MGFRDDREASAQRIETLERAVATLSKELDAAARRAAEVDPLQQRLLETTRERDALHGDVSPKWEAQQQRLVRYAIAAVVLTIGIAAFAYRSRTSEIESARDAAAECATERMACESDTASLIRDRDRAIEEREHTASDLARAQGPLRTRARRGVLVRARVATVEGTELAIGEACSFVVTIVDGYDQCTATLTCGDDAILLGRFESHVDCTLDPATIEHGPARSGIAHVRTPPARFGVGALTTVSATQLGDTVPAVVYDAAARTIEVRRTEPRLRAHLEVVGTDDFLFQ